MQFKRNIITAILIGGLAGTSLVSCSKFLQESSQDLQYVHNYSQLDEILIGNGYEAHTATYANLSYTEQTAYVYFPWLNLMDDDITEYVAAPLATDLRASGFGFYTWQKNPFVSQTFVPFVDDTWKKVYANINSVNTIAEKATELSDDPAQLKRIRGEALFLRAGYYFYMINTYAGAYNPATAATDAGVPLKVTAFVEDDFFDRSTQQKVYQQIISDLNEAEQDLTGVTQKSIYRADINAVNLLQSRVYLFMQDWGNALAAANKVLSRKPDLFSLDAYVNQTSFFRATSPEAIFSQGNNAMVVITAENQRATFQPSSELLSLFGAKDLRKSAFFEMDNQGKYRYTKVYRSTTNNITPDNMYSDNFFLRVAEAYLNKAEAEAMLGQPAEANAAINTLRRARFADADFVAVDYAGADLVSFIRDERRRELCHEGQRWFDLKRYAVNKQYPFTKTIVHPYSAFDGSGAPFLKATLQLYPNDAAYLLPIPDYVISFNQGVMAQNPDRPDRTF